MEDMVNTTVENFWSGKRVLITGHNGFKGSWLSHWLVHLGANVAGFSLPAQSDQPLFEQLGLPAKMDHATGDIRDPEAITSRVNDVDPEVVIHMAAQPLVLASYEDPIQTWQTNVMGSAHLMQALHKLNRNCAVVMVTTDKVYENREWLHPYREDDQLGGHDPYSASKAAMEIAIASWRKSFMHNTVVRMASARAGNVIGGGDWAQDRIVPDIIRSLTAGSPICVRNPNAVRPFQHVLEPLSGYLRLAEALLTRPADTANSYNFGPELSDLRNVASLVEEALNHWEGSWSSQPDPKAFHEANLLSLGIEAARHDLDYCPRWDSRTAIARSIEWYRAVHDGTDAAEITAKQINEFGAP